MHPSDAYGVGDDAGDELPDLPIPRPGEWSPMAAASSAGERLAPPRLGGGGASFTAASEHDQPLEPACETDDWRLSDAEREQLAAERHTWDLAAHLTSGMLANPGRSHASVKDAMGLFDQFLQEMHAYRRIASEFDLLGSEVSRRRAHGEYFQSAGSTPPAGSGSAPPAATPPAAAAPATPPPIQPRPMGDYRPIPPGARGPYTPGSMAGTPPTDAHRDDDVAA